MNSVNCIPSGAATRAFRSPHGVSTPSATAVAPAVDTPWGDRNARVAAPDGMQLTLFTLSEES